MIELASTDFRKAYARLREPCAVTVNGHIIGVWHPGPPSLAERTGPIPGKVGGIREMSQAERDAILRRIAK